MFSFFSFLRYGANRKRKTNEKEKAIYDGKQMSDMQINLIKHVSSFFKIQSSSFDQVMPWLFNILLSGFCFYKEEEPQIRHRRKNTQD